jgi:hypothetical protein
MPTELYAGTLSDFNGSMAKDIEDALTKLIGPVACSAGKTGERPACALHRDRQRGDQSLINHLQKKQAALESEFDVGPIHVTTNPDIKVRT